MFCTFICRHCTATTWKCQRGCKQATTKFSFLTWIWLSGIQPKESSPTIWQSEWVGIIAMKTEITRIPLYMRLFPCHRCPRILTSSLRSISAEKNDFSQKLSIYQFDEKYLKGSTTVGAHEKLLWAVLKEVFVFPLCEQIARPGENYFDWIER